MCVRVCKTTAFRCEHRLTDAILKQGCPAGADRETRGGMSERRKERRKRKRRKRESGKRTGSQNIATHQTYFLFSATHQLHNNEEKRKREKTRIHDHSQPQKELPL